MKMKRFLVILCIFVPCVISAMTIPAAAQNVQQDVGYTLKVHNNPNNRDWTATITFKSFNQGNIVGQIEWPSERSINQIEGTYGSGTFNFRETKAIKPGGAHLNCVYMLTYNARSNSFEGKWYEEGKANSFSGTCSFSLSALTPSTSGSNASTITLTGSQSSRESGKGAELKCIGIELPNGGVIISVSDAGAGFWLQSSSIRGTVRNFSSAAKARGIALPRGKYYAYPNLPNQKTSGSVTVTIRKNPSSK
jgi:hypothetical protein